MNADVEKLVSCLGEWWRKESARWADIHQIQATYMEEIGKAVDSRITTKAGVRSLCGPNAIRCLTAHTSFCEDLVHGLCSMPTTVNAVLLATVPYSALEKSNWAGETDWVGDIVRGDHDWILPIRDGDSWQAARLSWSGRRILCYNPICSAETASSSLRILKVSRNGHALRDPRLTTGPQDSQGMVQDHRGRKWKWRWKWRWKWKWKWRWK